MKTNYTQPGKSERECKYDWFDSWDKLTNFIIQLSGKPKLVLEPDEIAIDPHIHTLYSHCSIAQPMDIILHSVKLGLGGIAIMDHNDVRGANDAIKCSEHLKDLGEIPQDFLVIPGTEINTKNGHVGALFFDEVIKKPLSVEDTVRIIHEAGGLAVAVHPYHSSGIKDAIFDYPFDAVEIFSGSVFNEKQFKQNLALINDSRLSNKALLGSSDAHYVNAIGVCATAVKLEEKTLEGFKQAVIEHKTRPITASSYSRIRKMLGGIKKLR